ncbi:ABC transporter ATP-binding protein [Streptomyces lincolnensis]|uniref:ABC transporter ATP-binding protein n=1 Tax=Streptomyces lincolnensis TaxID=1915 RepID=UPI0009A0FE6D
MEVGPVDTVTTRPRHPHSAVLTAAVLTAAVPVSRSAGQAAGRQTREAMRVGTAGAARPSATGCRFAPRCPPDGG